MSKKEKVPSKALSPNITERKQMDEQTREIEELYRNMVELSPDSILTIDTKGVITSCNTAATRLLGYSKDEMVGKHFSKLGAIRLKDLPKYLKLFSTVLRGEVTEPLELTFYRKDRTPILTDIRISLLKVGGKTILQSTGRDITGRKRLEQEIQDKNEQLEAQNEELRAANEELQASEEELRATNEELEAANEELREAQEQLIRSEKLAAIGQLAGGVGHELRNPLGAIKNAAYYIKGKVSKSELGQQEPRVMEFLDIVEDEINTSNKIINDLLGFSRVRKPSVSPTQIKKVIKDALSHMPIPENIELTEKLDSNLPQVEIDPDQIHQVFINLFMNSVQAMPEGGKLKIDAREKGRFLEVGVSDTGGGIPTEYVDKIFDPLFTTKAKGIGLGLAVCKAIIDRHEGNIAVKSRAGKGTTFSVKLPLKSEQKSNIGGK